MHATPAISGQETMPFDSRHFRDALGDFPTGVVIATAIGRSGEPLGITVSSFNAVSLDPPLILFSVGRDAKGFSEWLEAERFAINVLHEEQHPISSRFGRSAPDKWEGVCYEPGLGGVRIVTDALAVFQCERYAQYEGGDHIILVGRVVALARSQQRTSPLIFFRGRYRTLG